VFVTGTSFSPSVSSTKYQLEGSLLDNQVWEHYSGVSGVGGLGGDGGVGMVLGL
jgi:hypothetical protein